MTIKKKKAGRPTRRPTIEQLAMLYEMSTAADIAKEYEVSVATVRGWIRKARIEANKGIK